MVKALRFFSIRGLERRYFLLAIYYSAIARILVLFVPFRKYSFWLGKYGIETVEQAILQTEKIKVISIAIHRASRVTPWRYKCLEQAMVAKKLLNKNKLPSTIYFGVRKENAKMEAHAWIRCGDIFVTGGRNRSAFTVVSWFS
ncbi:MAG: stage V sporulation protein S [Bacteroidetes bacterium HGW-Bacteroidetes-21]|jgi:hypothetical protein|nr:MAG: stage V sporulation protein S [Bacteroidetes bacterium HGW-Bacteroidetes-21]